jgi:nitronate monooxygenase
MYDDKFSLYPVIQAPMAGGIVNPSFVAAVCNNGFLGFIPGGYLDINSLEQFIIDVKVKLKPGAIFGVNIFLEDVSRDTEQCIAKTPVILQLEQTLRIKQEIYCLIPKSIEEEIYIDLFIRQEVPIVSCTFGFFKDESIRKLKAKGIKIIGNATSISEVNFCIQHGVDAIVVQGSEAGGHQASFLTPDKNNKSSVSLLEEVRALYPKVVLIAAGGISTKNINEYFISGANYVQMGTAFMMTYESNLSLECKEYIKAKTDTVLTKAITGKWARGVNNLLVSMLEQEDDVAAFPIRHYLTSKLRAEAKKQGKVDYSALWVGSNHDNLRIISLENLIDEIKHALRLIK